MKLAAVGLVGLCLCLTVQGQEKKDVKIDCTSLEKMYDLKVKSSSFDKGSLLITLEFTKDLQESQVSELKECFEKPKQKIFRAIFFDGDNVSLDGSTTWRLNIAGGEISGVKGDAFRISIPSVGAQANQAVKIVVRPNWKVEVKEEPKTEKTEKK